MSPAKSVTTRSLESEIPDGLTLYLVDSQTGRISLSVHNKDVNQYVKIEDAEQFARELVFAIRQLKETK